MNRRQFIRNAAGAAIATRIPAAAPVAQPLTATIGEWADYPPDPSILVNSMVSYNVMFTLGVPPKIRLIDTENLKVSG